MLSRLDAFLTPEGPRFIEINSDAPAGFGYSDAMAEVFRAAARSSRPSPGEHAVAYEPSDGALVRRGGRRMGAVAPAPQRPRVAIVDWAEVRTRADQEILSARLRGPRLRVRPRGPAGA